MKILVINCGSSSLKYQLFDMKHEDVLAKGLVERIGMETAMISYKPTGQEEMKEVCEILEHKEAIRKVLEALTDPATGVISSVYEISAVGHRIAHGGEEFSDSARVDDSVIAAVRKNFTLAPLHNPANMKGIEAFLEVVGNEIPMVCVFDTAFHQTMPEESYLYALPKVLYHNLKIRRYGFHGTSHKYVSSRLSEMTGQPLEGKRIISCHIGNGASITAIKDGKSVDTSMGMTPLEGLMMGTRSGDLDPAIVPFLMEKEELSVHEVNSLLNKHSGLAGISGIGGDLREIEEAMQAGHADATLAFNMYIHRILKYVGAFAAELNGVDALIFTGGVGENSDLVRQKVCERLSYLGLAIDSEQNRLRNPKERRISTEASKVDVHIIPTNEELMIARDTLRIISNK